MDADLFAPKKAASSQLDAKNSLGNSLKGVNSLTKNSRLAEGNSAPLFS